MKVLMDEGGPGPLRRALQEQYPEHEFISAQRQRLTGDSPLFAGLNPQQKDKRLLELAAERKFDAVITKDQGMEGQQDRKTPINVITLDAGHEHNKNYQQHYRPMIPEIYNQLSQVQASITNGDPPTFRRILYENMNAQQEKRHEGQAEPAPGPEGDDPDPTKPSGQKRPEAPAQSDPPPAPSQQPSNSSGTTDQVAAEKARIVAELRQQREDMLERQRANQNERGRGGRV